MRLTDLLAKDRVSVCRPNGGTPLDKPSVLKMLADMLGHGAGVDGEEVERVLWEREQLQSTGIGEGVAIPHGALSRLESQCASVLIVPEGVDFAAIDGLPVNILFAVVGPKRATGEHLKTLARVSRLLRNKAFRDRLIAAPDGAAAHSMIASEEVEPR